MPQKKTIVTSAIVGLTCVSVATFAVAQGRQFRYHDEIRAAVLRLMPAVFDAGQNATTIREGSRTLTIQSNGIPDHLVGRFPNRGNPNAIKPQRVSLKVPARPEVNARATSLDFGWMFGVSLEGVAFDPLAAEFWHGNPRSGWSYNVLSGALQMGLDENHAHVQRGGKYHYHGVPSELLEQVGYSSRAHSPLIGYAADGFPIYALTGVVDGRVTKMTSSYRLKSGQRPGGAQPSGRYDGTFNEDYTYVAGAGNLDACNGAYTVSAEYPNGTYAYFLTEGYPVVPRCFAGTPDASFQFHRRR